MAAEEVFEAASGRARLRSELTGALGDSITVIPIVAALGALSHLALGPVLALFGVFQIVWGLRYRLPLSVEPMKALAGLAIAGSLSMGEFAAAGLLAGATLLVLGRGRVLGRVEALVGQPVVRGVQLGVALLLVRTGLRLAGADLHVAVVAGVLALGAVALGYPRASALLVTALGAGVALRATGVPALSVPTPVVPPLAFDGRTVSAALAQLAMTVGNAAIATSLLCADLFDAEVPADDLATSMGVMTLVSVPLGGLPMCHGSGGLAGKYAFGARTYLANLALGALYLGVALVAGTGLVAAFPMAVLGVLLLAVAGGLGRTALRSDRRWLTVGVGLVALVADVGVAFVVGVAVHLALSRWASRGSPSP